MQNCLRGFLRTSAISIALASVVFAALSLFESFSLGETWLSDGPPKTTSYYILRSLIAFVLSILCVGGAYLYRGVSHDLGRRLSPRERSLAICSLGSFVLLIAVFLIDPILFNRLGDEDGPVEWVSAILPIGGSVLIICVYIRTLLLNDLPEQGIARWLKLTVAPALALFMFVVGAEEISWGQRLFGFATPEAIEVLNRQGEFNLHNVHTGLFEHLYYLASFVYLILLPFASDAVPKTTATNVISAYIPSKAVAVVSAPMAALNYDMWNAFPIQMAAMMTVLVLLFYRAGTEAGERTERLLLSGLAAIMVGAQLMFLFWGQYFVRPWDVTEYKEMFISIGFGLFAFEFAKRLHSKRVFERRIPEAASRIGSCGEEETLRARSG